MKLFVILLSFYSFSSFACRCMGTDAQTLAKSPVVVEGEVIISQKNKTVIQMTKLLGATVELDRDYTGDWFVFEGTKDNGTSCPGNNVERKVGSKIMFFPAVRNLHKDIFYEIQKVNTTVWHCGSFSNYFLEGSYRYEEVSKLLEK